MAIDSEVRTAHVWVPGNAVLQIVVQSPDVVIGLFIRGHELVGRGGRPARVHTTR